MLLRGGGEASKNLLESGRNAGDGGRARRVVCRAGTAWYRQLVALDERSSGWLKYTYTGRELTGNCTA